MATVEIRKTLFRFLVYVTVWPGKYNIAIIAYYPMQIFFETACLRNQGIGSSRIK